MGDLGEISIRTPLLELHCDSPLAFANQLQILACAIVVTILLGCVKLVYVHWQLRKHTKAVELGDDEQVIKRQMSQRRRVQRIKNEVPFGIRAIEEGIEVEGVWISRTNTPEPLSRESSGASLIPKSNQPAADGTAPGHDNSTETGMLVEDIADGHRSTHQSLGTQAQLESQSGSIPTREIISPSFISRVRTPFFTSSRYSSISQTPRTSSDTSGVRRSSRFSGTPAYTHVRRSSEVSDERQQHDGVHSADSTASSDEVIAASEPLEIRHEVSFAQHNPANLEFELMQSHRRSQAAEMGQLLPRSRRPASKDCSDRLRDSARSSYEVPPLLHVEIPNPRLSASLTSDMKHNTPPIETETRSSAQILDPAVNGHAASGKIFTEVRIVASDGRDFPMTQNDGASQVSESTRSSFEVRESPVIRGHGSGFEILKPGTFRYSLPPISMHNGPQSRSRDRGRKLQKRRRSSEDSNISMEERRRTWAGALPTP